MIWLITDILKDDDVQAIIETLNGLIFECKEALECIIRYMQ